MKLKKQYDCNLVMMNDLIGGKWKLRILWHIMNGDNRFSMLEKTIDSTGILCYNINGYERNIDFQ